MEKTPNFKSSSKYFKNCYKEANPENNLNTSNPKLLENESPGYITCTQDGFENIDVVWDWNSPQSKKVPKKSQKRLALSQSPKTSFKRHLSNNSIQGFEKLQEELRLLKEEIAVPEHEDCLLLSPIEEAEYKNVDNSDSIHNIELENFINESEDFFNDSLDEQLLICTTQIENKINVESKKSECDNSAVSNSEHRKNNNTTANKRPRIDGSEKTNSMTDTINNSNISTFMKDNLIFESSIFEHSDRNKILESSSTIKVGKVEFHRTQSFEMSNLEHQLGISNVNKETIEKKRQEALAKLELKKKQGTQESPVQCSSEEIERKRQEALAKREAKKQQEIIERKRQEALKRLELTRKKNASNVRSSLTSRLN